MSFKTPYTDAGLRRGDAYPSAEAVVRAWTEQGSRPLWHARAREVVRDAMPALARALDRLAAEAGPAPTLADINREMAERLDDLGYQQRTEEGPA